MAIDGEAGNDHQQRLGSKGTSLQTSKDEPLIQCEPKRKRFHGPKFERATGLQPAVTVSASNGSVGGYVESKIDSAALTQQSGDATCRKLAAMDDNLRRIVLRWSSLPEEIRKMIISLAVVEVASSPRCLTS